MADLMPAQPVLPLPPATTDRYLIHLHEALYRELVFLRRHLNGRILEGTAAERPPADGSQRFFWQTDGTPHLEYDSGTWNAV